MHFGRADIHIHTQASDGVATVNAVLNHVQKHTNLDVISITDHDRVDASLWAYEHRHNYSFDIIPATEVSSRDGHILGLWVTRSIPKNLSLVETVSAIHEQNGIAILAHPYHFQIGVVYRSWWQYTRRPEMLIEAGIDAIEVHNAGMLIPGENSMARCLGHILKIATTGSSDAHTLGAIGTGVTRFKGHTANDLRRAIVNNKTAAEGRSWHLNDYWQYIRESTHNTSNEFVIEQVT